MRHRGPRRYLARALACARAAIGAVPVAVLGAAPPAAADTSHCWGGDNQKWQRSG